MHYFFTLIRYLYSTVKNYLKADTIYKQKAKETLVPISYLPYPTHKKPPWVKDEIIRIKALSPHSSSRVISHIFNAKHDTISVGKTFVAYTLSNHAYEIQVLRKELKNKPAHKVVFNNTWGIDLTFLAFAPNPPQ